MTREEQKTRRRELILNAALEVFVQKGFHGAKISEIAREAGMSVGLLFHYFGNKEDVYTELIRIGLTGPASMWQIPAENPAEFFRAAAESILAELKKGGYTAKMFAFMIQASISPATEAARELLTGMKPAEDSVPLIENGQRLGQLKQGNPLALSFAFWSAVNGIALMRAIGPDIPLPKADWLVDILLNHGGAFGSSI